MLGFQSFSEKTVLGSASLASDRMDAKEEVMTTRFTPGADFLMAFRMDVVPIMAGSRSSVLGSDHL